MQLVSKSRPEGFPPAQGKKFVAVFAVCVAALIVLSDCWHIVPPGHRGVRVTLGSVDQNMVHEGFAWKLPFMQRISDVPIKQITQESSASSFSADLQTVSIKYAVLYRLPEQKVVELFQQYSGDPYQSLVEPRVQEAIKKEAAEYKAEAIVKDRKKIKESVKQALQDAVGDLVIINDFVMQNIDLTDELEKAIESKQVMEQQAQAKEYELKKAEKEAEITIVNAKAEAEAVRIKGEALKASPEVIQLEIVKKWNGISPQYVETSAGGANILLPIKK